MEKYKELVVDMTLAPEIILEQLIQQQTRKVASTQDIKVAHDKDEQTKK